MAFRPARESVEEQREKTDEDVRKSFFLPLEGIDGDVLGTYVKQYLGEDSGIDWGKHPKTPRDYGYLLRSRLEPSRVRRNRFAE